MSDAKRCDVGGCGCYFGGGDAIHGKRLDVGATVGQESCWATVWWEFKREVAGKSMDVCPLCTRMAIRAIVASWEEDADVVVDDTVGPAVGD